MFELKHQDGNLKYNFKDGGFALNDAKLYISVETIAVESEQFPNKILCGISGYPVSKNEEKIEILISSGTNYELPYVFFYSTFHADQIQAKININFISDNEIKVFANFISDDVLYYDANAKPNEFLCEIILFRKNINELLIPS